MCYHYQCFVDLLQTLLPRGCCRIIYHSDCYEESWRCNFLGQNPDTILPDHLVSAERFLLVEIVPQPEETANSLDSDLSDTDEEFRHFNFRLINPVPLPEKGLSHAEVTVICCCFSCAQVVWIEVTRKVIVRSRKCRRVKKEEEAE